MTAPAFNIGNILNPGQHIQRLQTAWTDEFTDQFGRRYAANYDTRNMRPKEELRPMGFNPPWLPPMKYIAWERDGGFRFRWDFVTMANDLTDDATAYYASVFEFMMEYMPGVEPPELGDPVPTKVLRSPLGKPPLSPAIPLACEAGDPWILGMAGAAENPMLKSIIQQSATANGRQALALIRERLAQKVGTTAVPTIAPQEDPSARPIKSIADVDPATFDNITYKEFLAAAMKAGMSMADGAAAWKAHRENLALEKAS